MSKNRIVVVLGMHRSGTSTITRGLQALGVNLGDNLLPAIAGENDKGFWEDVDVNRLNERLLAKAESAWYRLALFDPAQLRGDAFAAERYEAATLLEKKMTAHAVHGLKDPRLSILLPFWKCVFEDLGIEENYIIALRNPLEVAQSLVKRSKILPTASHALWLKHTWTAIRHSDGKSRLGVSYARVMNNPAEELARIASAFDLKMPNHSDPALIDYLGEFITPELRHNRIADRELHRTGNLPAGMSPLYSILTEWCEAAPGHSLDIPAKVKSQVETFWTVGEPLLILSDALTGRATRNATEAANIDEERAELAKSLDEQRALLVEKEKTFAEALDQQQALLAKRVKAFEDTLTQQRTVLAEREKAFEDALTQQRTVLAEREKAFEAALTQQRTVLAEREKAFEAALEQQKLLLSGKEKSFEAALDLQKHLLSDKEKELATTLHSSIELKAQLTARDERIAGLEADLEAARMLVADEAQKLHLAEAEIGQANDRLDNEKLRIARLERQIEVLHTDARSQAESEAAMRKSLLAAEKKLLMSEGGYLETLAKLGAAESLVAARDLALQEARSGAQALADRQAAADAKILSLEAVNAGLKDESAEKTKTVRLLRQDVYALRSSTSWRLTKPIRMLGTLLTYPHRLRYRLAGKETGRQPTNEP